MWKQDKFITQFLSNDIQVLQYYSDKSHKNKTLFKTTDKSIDKVLTLLKSNTVQNNYKNIFKTFLWKRWNNYIVIRYEFNESILNKTVNWKTKNNEIVQDKIVYINGFIINPDTNMYDLLLEGEQNFIIWLSECQDVLL